MRTESFVETRAVSAKKLGENHFELTVQFTASLETEKSGTTKVVVRKQYGIWAPEDVSPKQVPFKVP